jgi:hypothetical protein
MTMLNSDVLLALGRRRDYFTGAWICAAVNIGANIALLTSLGGKGVVLAKLASEAAFLAWCHLRLPAELRRGLARSLATQAAVLGGFLALWLLHHAGGARALWFALSLAGCAALARFGRAFSRETYAVLRDN